jgi:hypothetical protein
MQQQQKHKPSSSSSLFPSVVATTEERDSGLNNDKLYSNFIHSIKTQITRKTYLSFLKYYMDFLGLKTFREFTSNLKNGKPNQFVIVFFSIV